MKGSRRFGEECDVHELERSCDISLVASNNFESELPVPVAVLQVFAEQTALKRPF